MTHGRLESRSAKTVLAELAQAGGYRSVEPRVSVSAPYAPFRPVSARERRRSLRPGLLSEVARSGLAHEPGLTTLLLGDAARAVDLLERTHPARSSIDLAAAYYTRGLSTDSLLDFCRALNALRDAGDSPEATFNRALILEQLSDSEAAAEAWERYLAKDGRSGWAAEARRHLARTRQPSVAAQWLRDKPRLRQAALVGDAAEVRALAARYPLMARRLAELELLPEWGGALSRGDADAAQKALGAARLIVAERLVPEERLLEDAIREIDALPYEGLARAYAAYGEGNAALDVTDNAAALASFSRALALAGEAPVFSALVVPNGITAHYRRYEYAEAEASIASTRKRYRDRAERYPSLFARLDWLEGLIHIARPDAMQALRAYERALAGYERLREAEYQAAQHVNQADSYIYLGDSERAAVHVRKALRLVTRAEDPRRLQGILKIAARLSVENAGAEAAVAFQDRLVRVARTSADPMRLPDALVSRSAVLSRAGRRDEAMRDLGEVRLLAPRIADGPTRDRLEADAAAAEAFAYRDRDDRRALGSLSRAIDLFRGLEMRAFLAQLLLERGRAQLRLGDTAEAERDFRAGIDVLESQRNLVSEASLRIAYFDRADRIFADLAALLLRRGRTAEAFDVLERFRSRELLDQTAGRSMAPMTVAAIRERLPHDTLLVTYTLHAKGLLTFVVTRDALRAFDTGAGEAELGPLVDTIGAAFDAGTPLPPDALRRLGELLVDRVAPPAGSRIVFVPDELLSRVPYAALRLADGRYLLESHTISLSPSATVLAWNAGRTRAPRHEPRSILVVASNERPAGYDELPPLTRTIAEATRIAGWYAPGKVLSATDADAGSVLAAARDYDVLHFAGHSVVDLRTPARSALLVGATGRITAAQIEAAALSNLELVVLGGCNTGAGRNYRSEGAMSLARAFLAASVPAVVGTIASVEDADAERVLTAFHRAYARGLDAPAALREAQLRMLRSTTPEHREPARWSAYQLAGGVMDRREK